MDKRKYIIGGALAAILVIGGGAYTYYTEVYAPAHAPLTLSGNVDVRQVSVAFRASDRIDQIFVEEGDQVKAGQVLAKLDSRELELAISKLKSQIAAQEATVTKLLNGSRSEDIEAAQNAVDQARAALNLAQSSYSRKQGLYQDGVISELEFDKEQSNYDGAKAKVAQGEAELQKLVNGSRSEDIAQAEANLQALKDELARQEYVLSQYQLVAPSDGIIRSRLLEVGDMASPQKPVFKLSVLNKKWIRAYVNERELSRIYEGQAAHVKVDGLDQSIDGQVGYISDQAEFTPKTVQTNDLRTDLVYEVRIYVEDPTNVLRMGQPATVTFD